MANPQLENGYARIANEIFDNIVKRHHKFNGTQYAIVLAVWRYTYGFGRKDHELAVSFIAEYLEGDLRGVKKELSYLIERKVLVVTEEAYGSKSRKIGFNKNYDQWLAGDKTPPRKKQSLGVQSSPSEGSNHTPRGGDDSPPKKEKKKNIKKEDIYMKIPPSKTQYADTVFLTPEQYEKLCSDFGKTKVDDMIEALDEWQGNQKPSKHKKDHNKAIRVWIKRDQARNAPKESSRARGDQALDNLMRKELGQGGTGKRDISNEVHLQGLPEFCD
ncbi:replication protein [Paenibacillus polymyxa]|uniref:replication protein n=1 Tax=Paenibacillus polymyxa TaxID=1406 RepID=UPI002AB4FF69|nr:replication protein [Paenibacillus polymyxa]MDY7993342.1 replication protein [Paenibacillus polymyxa]MDY8120057.1 replication protein [Paenibacillus polymyxa]